MWRGAGTTGLEFNECTGEVVCIDNMELCVLLENILADASTESPFHENIFCISQNSAESLFDTIIGNLA